MANLSSDELFTEDSVYVEVKVTDDTALDKVNCVLEDEEGNIDYEEMTELDDGLFNIGLSDFKDRGSIKFLSWQSIRLETAMYIH